jgi:hypothetical protein
MELGIGYFKVIICQTILFVYIKLIGILKRFVTKRKLRRSDAIEIKLIIRHKQLTLKIFTYVKEKDRFEDTKGVIDPKSEKMMRSALY